MNKVIKKLALYSTVGLLGTFSLTGCGSSDSESKKEVIVEEDNSSKDEQVETKYFDVGEHVFYEALYVPEAHYNYTSFMGVSGSINVPTGYHIFDIEEQGQYKYGENHFYMAFYVNDVPVEAEGIYNEETESYDYSNPGTPVLENTNELEENEKTR